jgi:hypothetical protein
MRKLQRGTPLQADLRSDYHSLKRLDGPGSGHPRQAMYLTGVKMVQGQTRLDAFSLVQHALEVNDISSVRADEELTELVVGR